MCRYGRSHRSSCADAFFLLLCRALLRGERHRLCRLETRMGAIVTCRSATSTAILNGASLMIPGITGLLYGEGGASAGSSGDQGETPAAGCTAFVHTVGVDAAYAVGLISHGLLHHSRVGLGVFIVHCYGDKLWQAHVNDFAVYGKSISREMDIVPAVFGESTVGEDLSCSWGIDADGGAGTAKGAAESASAEELVETAEDISAHDAPAANAVLVECAARCNDDGSDERSIASDEAEAAASACTATTVTESSSGEDGAGRDGVNDWPRWATLFQGEDDILNFCLCQAMESIAPTELPLLANVFSGILLASYPAYLFPDQPPLLSFEKTRYKKALLYLEARSECVTVAQESQGVHTVVRLDRSAPLFRSYKRKYGEFLAKVHTPMMAEQKERNMMGDIAARSDGNLPQQRFVSLTSMYRLDKPITYLLARALLGEEAADTMLARSAGHERVMDTTCHLLMPRSLPASLEGRMHTRQAISQNLRTFLSAASLLIHDEGEGRRKGIPVVELGGAFACVRRRNEHESTRVPVTDLTQRVVDLFRAVHHVSIEQVHFKSDRKVTVAVNTTLEGACRRVHLSTNNKKGRMKYLCVRYLDALGFNISYITHFWSRRFSMQCWVRENAVKGESDMHEVRVPYAMTALIVQSLHTDLGLPDGLIDNCV